MKQCWFWLSVDKPHSVSHLYYFTQVLHKIGRSGGPHLHIYPMDPTLNVWRERATSWTLRFQSSPLLWELRWQTIQFFTVGRCKYTELNFFFCTYFEYWNAWVLCGKEKISGLSKLPDKEDFKYKILHSLEN